MNKCLCELSIRIEFDHGRFFLKINSWNDAVPSVINVVDIKMICPTTILVGKMFSNFDRIQLMSVTKDSLPITKKAVDGKNNKKRNKYAVAVAKADDQWCIVLHVCFLWTSNNLANNE